MVGSKITPEIFRAILPQICDRETSQSPDGWKPENPLWGHCAVVSLVAQNLFGGDLLRSSLEGTKFFGSHYWNILPGGVEYDFTAQQFGDQYPKNLIPVVRERGYVISFPDTAQRYKLLTWRLAKAIHGNNPIFSDLIYRECYLSALDSECQKLWFGCVITLNGNIVSRTANKKMEPLRRICEPTCIRLAIQSRTESMIGACGHAEEFALWDVASRGIDLRECELWIAGLYPTGLPLFKSEADHTCIRCSVQMYQAGLRAIHVPVNDRWEQITTAQGLHTSLSYAMKEKKV